MYLLFKQSLIGISWSILMLLWNKTLLEKYLFMLFRVKDLMIMSTVTFMSSRCTTA